MNRLTNRRRSHRYEKGHLREHLVHALSSAPMEAADHSPTAYQAEDIRGRAEAAWSS